MNEKEEKFSTAVKNILMMLSIVSLIVTLGAQCSKTKLPDQSHPQICVICDPPCTGRTYCNSATGKCEATATEQDKFVTIEDSSSVGAPASSKHFYILQIVIPRPIR